MLWGGVDERKPVAIRRREVVDCFDDDLDCLIAGIHFDTNLCVFKIYICLRPLPPRIMAWGM